MGQDLMKTTFKKNKKKTGHSLESHIILSQAIFVVLSSLPPTQQTQEATRLISVRSCHLVKYIDLTTLWLFRLSAQEAWRSNYIF